MHEFSAAASIVKTIIPAAEKKDAIRIKSVKMKIGKLTLLNPDQLNFCFEVAAEGTLAEEAKLQIEEEPAILKCRNCGKEFPWNQEVDDPALHMVPPTLKCECGSTSIKIQSGREMKVVSITVERNRDGT